jgi:hypothetical protein
MDIKSVEVLRENFAKSKAHERRRQGFLEIFKTIRMKINSLIHK